MFNHHKSPETFDSKTYTDKFKILNGNILYLTHEIDQIKIIVQQIHNTVNLKQQALDIYQTSPQTESNEQ